MRDSMSNKPRGEWGERVREKFFDDDEASAT